jgi:hypothetical protein
MTQPLPRGKTARHNGTTRRSDGLEKRLLAYAAAGAGLLAMPQLLHAEVIYTPVNITLSNGQLAIDLNHDGVIDFVVNDRSVTCCIYARDLSVDGMFVGSSQNSVEGVGGNASALTRGVEVGPDDLFLAAPMRMAVAIHKNSFSHVVGLFANKTERSLGLRFIIKGETHYGWATFSVVNAGFSGGKPVISATLTGYAYETVANQALVVGRTKGPSAAMVAPSLRPESAGPLQAATLGILAMGSPGLPVWRRGNEPGAAQ